MSDPVTNTQIEDVLSSIRKLVSEEVRAQTRPRKAPAPQAGKPEMLILTPAQRVPEDEATTDPAGAESDYAGAAETGADFDMDAFSRELLRDTQPEEAESAEAEEEPVEEPLFQHHGSARRAATISASRTLGGEFEDEGANAGSPLDISAYAAPDDAPAEDDTAEGLFEDAAFEAADESAEDDHDDLIAPEEEVEALAPIPSFLRSRGISSLNEPIRAAAAEPEEDALSWEDHQASDVPAANSKDTDTEIEGDLWAEPGDPEDSGQAMMIDEEILRDMVSEIVRQELQGALGERITRNVRKLVRREIQRALTAHDLL
ncbi:hypothetical protein [Pseudooceanicola sp.]|uniref:hypothetical protein n=1 Tax=Pseudooceanicola sp. TaxID=1914328 RepID=UPI004058F191